MTDAATFLNAIHRKAEIVGFYAHLLGEFGRSNSADVPIAVQAHFESAIWAAQTIVEYAMQAAWTDVRRPSTRRLGSFDDRARAAERLSHHDLLGRPWMENTLTKELRGLRNDIAHSTYDKTPTGIGVEVVLPTRSVELNAYLTAVSAHLKWVVDRREAMLRALLPDV